MSNMIRPNWDEFSKDIKGIVACSCKQYLDNFPLIREHWQRGHFDYVGNSEDQKLKRVAHFILNLFYAELRSHIRIEPRDEIGKKIIEELRNWIDDYQKGRI